MLLKKITLDNFRCFKGHHEMLFSTNNEKNVTLVLAENGTGKTTMVQAFQWILYSKVDEFNDKGLLNLVVKKEMPNDSTIEVRGELELEHKNIEYKITRTQLYRKDSFGVVKADSPKLSIAQKDKYGNTSFNDVNESLSIINSILPESLSKYFFFSGERIDTMSKEALKGKVQEFKNAVQNILGLDVLNKAKEHLQPNKKDSVIGRYNSLIDENGSQAAKELRNSIYMNNDKIAKNKALIDEIEPQITYYKEQIKKCDETLLQYKEVEDQQRRLNQVKADIENYKKIRTNQIAELTAKFEIAYKYMSSKLISDSLVELKETNSIDKGIPDIRKSTIDFLMKRGTCICGADLHQYDSEAVNNLRDLLKYIPPESLGTQINHFKASARSRMRDSENYYDSFIAKLTAVRTTEKNIADKETEAGKYNENILNSNNESITRTKSQQNEYERTLSKLEDDLIEAKSVIMAAEKEIKRAESDIVKLELKEKKNTAIEDQRRYAQAAYNIIEAAYEFEEQNVRSELETDINDLFKQLYDGGMTISIDENYRIKSFVNGLQDATSNLDQNTAKSYSIIFAFIVGVLKMAKEKVEKKDENVSVDTSGEYPLVMDAPLSSFDKKRIKNICEVIPGIAKQVIIFIKDTDGDIAEKNMMDKVGVSYKIKMTNPPQQVDNYFERRGDLDV